MGIACLRGMIDDVVVSAYIVEQSGFIIIHISLTIAVIDLIGLGVSVVE